MASNPEFVEYGMYCDGSVQGAANASNNGSIFLYSSDFL